jgi:undecaprenyl-diphosphatase
MVQATADAAAHPAPAADAVGVLDASPGHSGALTVPSAATHWRLGVAVLGLIGLAALALSQADERAVFLWFNHAPFLPGAAWEALSVLGLGVSAAIVLLAALQGHRPQIVAALFLSFVTVGLPVNLLKRAVERPRPPAVLSPELFEVLGRPLTHGALPSGHSGTALAVMAIVLLAQPAVRRRLWVTPVVVVLCVGVLWSRMACGAHWPWDVLTGAAIGWLGGWLALALADRLGFTRWCGSARAQPWLSAVLLLASAASAFDDTGYPEARGFQTALAVFGGGVALWRLGTWLRERPGAGS